METEFATHRFQWPDYVVLVGMLMLSGLIGIYYACTGSRQSSTREYLFGDGRMSTFPVAMSMIASILSGITLLGMPAEVYFFGSMISAGTLMWFLVIPTTIYLYMPIFFQLQITSAYEYLELRFNQAARCLCSALFILQMLMYMSIVVYAPALSLSQVTGIQSEIAVSVTIGVCIFYTVLGGMKAVVWTDTLQVIVMVGSVVAVISKGAFDVGGLKRIWESNLHSGRLEYNFGFDLTTRHTFWNLVLGQYFTMASGYGVNQTLVQRFLTMQSIKNVRRALWINLAGLVTVYILYTVAGLILYAKYELCDPLSSKAINRPDQILPYFVMETMGSFPGIPGLFVAGVYSGSLSTVSSGLNSLAAISLMDFIRPFFSFFGREISDPIATRISKAVAVLYGIACFGFVMGASKVHSLVEVTGTVNGALGGPILGLFTLGMFFPWASSTGAIIGFVVSISTMLTIGFGALMAKLSGQLLVVRKPFSIEECFPPLNVTFHAPSSSEYEVASVYRLSYQWYSACGFFLVLVVGLAVSMVFKTHDPRKLNPKLICNTGNTLFWFLPRRAREFLKSQVGEDFVISGTKL